MYDRNHWHHEDEPETTDRAIAESAALGAAVGGLVAIIVNTLGLKNTIILCVIGYFVWKYWDEIKAFFAG